MILCTPHVPESYWAVLPFATSEGFNGSQLLEPVLLRNDRFTPVPLSPRITPPNEEGKNNRLPESKVFKWKSAPRERRSV